jgi:hypothetical protein
VRLSLTTNSQENTLLNFIDLTSCNNENVSCLGEDKDLENQKLLLIVRVLGHKKKYSSRDI